jgi:hypothetical protein
MKSLLHIGILLILITSCVKSSTKVWESDKFHLYKGFVHYIPMNDTLILEADLGVCTGFWKETNLFYFKNDQILLTTIVDINGELDTLPPIQYQHINNLNFQVILDSLPFSINTDSVQQPIFQINTTNDTIRYFRTNGLVGTIRTIEAYKQIKFILYNHLHLYHPLSNRN